MTDQVGKTEQLTDTIHTVMDQNGVIRKLENDKLALLDQLSDAGMTIKRLREAMREAERAVFARIREKDYVIVPREPIKDQVRLGHKAAIRWGSDGDLIDGNSISDGYRAMTSAIDQDAIEREVMK